MSSMHATDVRNTFIGIDLSGGLKPFTYVALDSDGKLTSIANCDFMEACTYLRSQKYSLTAINAPSKFNIGLVRKSMEEQDPSPGHLRGTDMRQAEYELRKRGISITPTSSRVEKCASWIQAGFEFYEALEKMGYKFHPCKDAPLQMLETNPQAAYCALIGRLLLPKPTLEGRLQRQLALYEKNVGIKDPMIFFEEITRHRFLQGILPTEYIHTPEELDALIAAYTALQAANQPTQVVWIGNEQEGQIVLPVPELKENYS
jgi:hypothetical protein